MLRYPNHLPRKLGFIRYILASWIPGDDSQFLRKFSQCLERSPHPDQGFAIQYDSEEFSSAESGTHLDHVWKWFLIRLLVDPDYGSVHVVSDEQRETLTGLARQLLAEIDESGSAEPSEAVSSSDWDPTEEAHSSDKLIRLIEGIMRPELEQDFEYKLARELPPCAASLWTGHNIRARIDFPPLGAEKPESQWEEYLVSGLAFLFKPITRLLGRLPPGPTGHYYRQINWLVELMNISWIPKTDREGEILQELLSGKTTHMQEYLKIQRLRWIEPADCELMTATFRSIQAVRQVLSEPQVVGAS